MNNESKVLRVFFSWQSDLPGKDNRHAIHNALKAAAKQLQSDTKGKTSIVVDESKRPTSEAAKPLRITVDQAAAGIPGAPHIAQAILRKIAEADVFVADISTINSRTRVSRKSPNPNVIFELGYAVAQLGWERIILVRNSVVTRDIDIPFDIHGHRFIPYRLPCSTPDETKKEKASLMSYLRAAILEIAGVDSLRPFQLQGMSEEEIRRTRDVNTLTGLFSHINLPILEGHLGRAPNYFNWDVACLRDEFNSYYNRTSFHLYDEALSRLVLAFSESWRASMPGEGNDYYRLTSSIYVQRFIGTDEAVTHHVLEESRAAYKQLGQGCDDLGKALDALLGYVRTNYPEIDVEMLGRKVGESILDSMKINK